VKALVLAMVAGTAPRRRHMGHGDRQCLVGAAGTPHRKGVHRGGDQQAGEQQRACRRLHPTCHPARTRYCVDSFKKIYFAWLPGNSMVCDWAR
jgi:hypothetical protein